MKRPLQLSLAIALALGGTNALALGLGPVHVISKLNQPLDAEIPILQGSAGEAEGLVVSLAGAEDFDRVGLNRSRITVPLEFSVVKSARGDLVIKVTSKDAVRETFLDFLVEANWPKGRLLREYTVLLDPPMMAPARSATAAAPAGAPGTVTLMRREPPPEQARIAAPVPRASAPKPAATAQTERVKAGEYGPVEAGETLSAVAREARPGGNLNQTMLALFKANPNAFYKDNINALKRGAILRVPSADEVRAIGSASEAAAQVQAQVEDWRGGRASPTLVADAGGKAASPASTAKPPKTVASKTGTADERLELVPPKAGKDSMAMADRPGTGAGSAAASGELKSELARTKEALTARDQESGELKSRVKELEDLKGKNDRLISLKDSEIADLQRKLKELQAPSDKAVASTAKPISPVPASPAPTAKADTGAAPTKDDIWGKDSSASSSTTPKKSDIGGAPATVAATAAAPSTTTLAASPSATAPAGAAPPTSAAAAADASVTAPAVTPPPAATAAAPAPVKPVASTAATALKSRPAIAQPAWYEEPWIKPAALAAGIVLLLLGLLGLRRRKPEPAVARASIADAFGDSPLETAEGTGTSHAFAAEETNLHEQLQSDPSNLGLHLELLSLYYAERDVARFQAAAADMHAHVGDPHQPEWLEAQAMGQELAPHDPLFGGTTHHFDDDDGVDDRDGVIPASHIDAVEPPLAHFHDDEFAPPHRIEPERADVRKPISSASDFAFDLDDDRLDIPPPAPAYVAPAAPVANHDDGFDFDLPPLDFDADQRAHDIAARGVSAPAGRLDEDYFPGEDAIGTKLDLAKAYMDMGDPEGARSMLEEVVAEGSEAQRAEAHRLMTEIR